MDRSTLGIHERRIAAPGELTSQMATLAARAASHVEAQSIDLIVLATSTWAWASAGARRHLRGQFTGAAIRRS